LCDRVLKPVSHRVEARDGERAETVELDLESPVPDGSGPGRESIGDDGRSTTRL